MGGGGAGGGLGEPGGRRRGQPERRAPGRLLRQSGGDHLVSAELQLQRQAAPGPGHDHPGAESKQEVNLYYA